MPTNSVQKVVDLIPRILYACRRVDARSLSTGRSLSPQQALVLDQLDPDTPVSLRALAAQMGVTAPTMSVAIGRLVREGYVRRGRDRTDGRRLDITLSPSGIRVRKITSSLDPRRVSKLLNRVAAADLPNALRGLTALANAAREDRPATSGRSRSTPASKRTRKTTKPKNGRRKTRTSRRGKR
jgi:DNA-binding MarR family transcriptional regulator